MLEKQELITLEILLQDEVQQINEILIIKQEAHLQAIEKIREVLPEIQAKHVLRLPEVEAVLLKAEILEVLKLPEVIIVIENLLAQEEVRHGM
jgi:hypothetical protein